MNISQEQLLAEAQSSGFRPDTLEKVALLLRLLNSIQSHPYLKGKLALKGGTALNLFFFNAPRLSVDIDLNYIGAKERSEMISERPKIEQALQAVFSREGFTVRRKPEEHAGGKWSLRYARTPDRTGNLEVDLNYMFRIPLWPLKKLDSIPVGPWKATGIPLLDFHEIAVGKLVALLSRKQARDLFDSHKILKTDRLDHEKLRVGFVVYGAMGRKDWRDVSIENIGFESEDLARQLIPTLRINEAQTRAKSREFAVRLVEECRHLMSAVLPFTASERHFLDLLLEKGEIKPELLTLDTSLQEKIKKHPLLKWKAENVKQFKGIRNKAARHQ
jgi:hypothetical protein